MGALCNDVRTDVRCYDALARLTAPPALALPALQVKVSEPSDEEKQRRREWALEKRRRAEAKARADAERKESDAARQAEASSDKLEARRQSIRERIARQHEIAAKMAAEQAAAEERARQEVDKFRGKPLYEKIIEEYEAARKQEVGG